MRIIRVTTLLAAALAGSATAQQAQPLTIGQAMTEQEYRAAGLDKLSAAEQRALQQWFERYIASLRETARGGAARAAPGDVYVVQDAVDEHFFMINGNLYRADTLCRGLKAGDRVSFAVGNALGACATARLVNLRTGNTCDVWCQ